MSHRIGVSGFALLSTLALVALPRQALAQAEPAGAKAAADEDEEEEEEAPAADKAAEKPAAAPEAEAVASLQAAIRGREIVRAHGKELYATFPDGIGRSRLTNVLIEKKLGTRGTGRNWNTVSKLAELLKS